MPMLPAPYRMSQQGSSWGGFGRAPRQQVPGAPQGMGAYAGAGNMPPAPQLQGMGSRTLTPEMAAQYKPQMMASALMNPQFAPPPGAAPAPAGGYAGMGTVPAPLGGMGGNETPAQRDANNAAVYGQQPPGQPGAGLLGNVAPNMAQAAAQQGQAMQPAGHPAMARPMPPPAGYAR